VHIKIEPDIPIKTLLQKVISLRDINYDAVSKKSDLIFYST
jgi:hypothetical protein